MSFSRFTAPLALALTLAAQPMRAQAPAAPPVMSASHRAAVLRLLDVTQMRQTTEQMKETMLKAQTEQATALGAPATASALSREILEQHLNYDTLEPEYVQAYGEVFTEAEVLDLIAFYETKTGQMLLAKMPRLMERSSQITMERLQKAMPALLERMRNP